MSGVEWTERQADVPTDRRRFRLVRALPSEEPEEYVEHTKAQMAVEMNAVLRNMEPTWQDRQFPVEDRFEGGLRVLRIEVVIERPTEVSPRG